MERLIVGRAAELLVGVMASARAVSGGLQRDRVQGVAAEVAILHLLAVQSLNGDSGAGAFAALLAASQGPRGRRRRRGREGGKGSKEECKGDHFGKIFS